MAEAKLTFNEETLDPNSLLYDLYSRLYEGMRSANEITPPDFTTSPPMTEDGEVDSAAIAEQLGEYSTILMKNSAYLFANSISSAIGGGSGGGGGLGFISRSGDAMEGSLAALYGFQAGDEGKLILDIYNDQNGQGTAHIEGNLIVNGKLTGVTSIDVTGGEITFNGTKVLYMDEDGKVHVGSSDLIVDSALSLDKLTIGNLKLTSDGIFIGEDEYYHSGNSNTETADWTMRNASVAGNLSVSGTTELKGRLSALHGFDLGDKEKALLYSEADGTVSVASDLNIAKDKSVQLNHKYILGMRDSNVVSIAAPGMILNLGDTDGTTPTQKIALQTGIYETTGNTRIISEFGDGNFQNSLSAGCGNGVPVVMKTYYEGSDNYGVVFKKYIALGDTTGPIIHTDDTLKTLFFEIPYSYVDGNGVARNTKLPISMYYDATTSLFKNQGKDWSASLHINTDGEFVVFDKPVEATSFSIISDAYKTCLIENALFLNENAFIEGLADGMMFSGNAYFKENIGSERYASGFAGYGWSIRQDELSGGYVATFDEVTVRKKMRVYELEIQKQSVTNGALWVSDSCSGDMVQEIA